MNRAYRHAYLMFCAALAVLLAGCGQESDLHLAAKPTPAANPAALANGKQPPAAPTTVASPPESQVAFPTPIPTVPQPVATTTDCPAPGYWSGSLEPKLVVGPVSTADPARIVPAAPPKAPFTQPATFTVTHGCNQRVLEMHVGETFDVVLEGKGAWSAASGPSGILSSEGLTSTVEGTRWRYRAVQPGMVALSLYQTPPCPAAPCGMFNTILNIGVIVK